ncbi:hypothetical protein ZWY2020_043548 [Hordeum vulgare]|nr:hypothetical protein ZWY2020_043548 [Hordeum vulgare]
MLPHAASPATPSHPAYPVDAPPLVPSTPTYAAFLRGLVTRLRAHPHLRGLPPPIGDTSKLGRANGGGGSNVRAGLWTLGPGPVWKNLPIVACSGSFREAHDAARGVLKNHTAETDRRAQAVSDPAQHRATPADIKEPRTPATRDCFPRNLTSSPPPIDQTAAPTPSSSASPIVLLASPVLPRF